MAERFTSGQARASLLLSLFLLAASVAGYGMRQHIFDYVVTDTGAPALYKSPPRLDTAVPLRPPPAWEKTFGDQSVERANAVAQFPDGALIFAGGAYSPETGYSRGTVFMLERDGALRYNRSLPGTGENEVLAVATDLEGGAYLAGLSNYALSLTKVSSDGELAWQRTFDGAGPGVAHDVALSPQGDVLLAGSVGVDPQGRVWRLTGTGRTLWSADLGPGHVYALAALPDGGAIAAGTGANQGYIVRLGGTGEPVWRQEGLGLGTVNALVFLPDGEILAVGLVNRTALDGPSRLVRLTAAGELVWGRDLLSDDIGAQINAVGARPDGTIVLGGRVNVDRPDRDTDMLLVWLDDEGAFVDERRIGGGEFDSIEDVIVAADGGVVLAGYTFSGGNGASDMWLASLGPSDQFTPRLTFDPLPTVVSVPEPEVIRLPAVDLSEPEPEIIPDIDTPPASTALAVENLFACQVFCETGNSPAVPYPVDVQTSGTFSDTRDAVEAIRNEIGALCRSSGGRADVWKPEPVCRPS